MHELSVTNSILETVIKHAEANRAKRVTKIRIAVGELSDLNGEWIQKYFDYVSDDSIAAGASIEVTRTPPGFSCHDCDTEFDVDFSKESAVHCPGCGGTNCTLERGREFFIDDMEIEL